MNENDDDKDNALHETNSDELRGGGKGPDPIGKESGRELRGQTP